MQFATAHTTDVGVCVNDWSLAPCIEHGACAGCEQHLIRKGDAVQRDRAETMLREQEELHAVARQEASEETYGASNFVSHTRRVGDALRRVLAVHDDPSIPDGDLVELGRAAPAKGRHALP